ncbi:MAG TPA: hypothetical protein VJ739_12490, partial [Gemmataceae bacterium]|nr:hypothetical protein [Gemmataceae bacterium]
MCRRMIRSLAAWLSPCLLVSLSPCLPQARAYDAAIDSPMYQDPDVPVPPVVTVFPEKAKDLWLRALARPEVEMQAGAAAAIARG